MSVAVTESEHSPLDITFRQVEAVGDLPPHHQDPFDRILVAQAIVDGLTLVTADRQPEPDRIPVIWT